MIHGERNNATKIAGFRWIGTDGRGHYDRNSHVFCEDSLRRRRELDGHSGMWERPGHERPSVTSAQRLEPVCNRERLKRDTIDRLMRYSLSKADAQTRRPLVS